MRKQIINSIIILFLSVAGIFSRVSAQEYSSAIATTDTTEFFVNIPGGWQLFSTYISEINTDSVRLEFIVRQTGNLNWQQEQFVGSIKKNNLYPVREQVLFYDLLNTKYQIRVTTAGKCYLKLLAGESSSILPVLISYEMK